MSKTHKIKIKSGDASTGELKISDKHIWTKKMDSVNWSIKEDANVYEITSIEKKSGSPEIFRVQPHNIGEGWEGKIELKPNFITTYEYSILWRAKAGGDILTYDPKISVLPNIGILALLPKIVAVVAMILVSIFSFHFFRKRKR
ncbi:MAG: hypothetical protein LH478_08730 [Chitinophagaceae bacterium]|nr:hypothetical protein [Chitinophagaceae bacterium]